MVAVHNGTEVRDIGEVMILAEYLSHIRFSKDTAGGDGTVVDSSLVGSVLVSNRSMPQQPGIGLHSTGEGWLFVTFDNNTWRINGSKNDKIPFAQQHMRPSLAGTIIPGDYGNCNSHL